MRTKISKRSRIQSGLPPPLVLAGLAEHSASSSIFFGSLSTRLLKPRRHARQPAIIWQTFGIAHARHLRRQFNDDDDDVYFHYYFSPLPLLSSSPCSLFFFLNVFSHLRFYPHPPSSSSSFLGSCKEKRKGRKEEKTEHLLKHQDVLANWITKEKILY